jgi:hypothetical protein
VANRQVALTGAHSVEVLGKLITAALEGEHEPAGQSSV